LVRESAKTMRVLLDTNILIHREAATVVRRDIGTLFFWLDRLKCDKCVHPASLEEIGKHRDPRVRSTFETKLQSYQVLKTIAPTSAAVQQVGTTDKTENDRNDTLLLNELYANRVDVLISEDRGLHNKALSLAIADRAFTIDAFLEKALAENPELVDYKVLAVRKVAFGNANVHADFFEQLSTGLRRRRFR
jgi:predicted nucleic acid-binding protein